MEAAAKPIVGLGEVLWDLLPAGRQLGGAPFNFAFHCHQLGHSSVIVSRVGDDDLGRDIRGRLASQGLTDAYVQADATHSTGTVPVAVDARGQPTFTITPDVAYDYLAWDERLESLAAQARAVCFGTLIHRHAVARTTVYRFLRAAVRALVVFDINLRQNFYNRMDIDHSLRLSNWVKLNDDELRTLQGMLNLSGASQSAALATLRNSYDLELACLTRGEHGCLVQTADEEVDVPGRAVKVVDTVGAGDAFTAGLLVYRLEGRPLREAAEFANRLAGRVAASHGGTPSVCRADLERG